MRFRREFEFVRSLTMPITGVHLFAIDRNIASDHGAVDASQGEFFFCPELAYWMTRRIAISAYILPPSFLPYFAGVGHNKAQQRGGKWRGGGINHSVTSVNIAVSGGSISRRSVAISTMARRSIENEGRTTDANHINTWNKHLRHQLQNCFASVITDTR